MTSTHQQPSPATASTPRVTAADRQTQVQALARYAARATSTTCRPSPASSFRSISWTAWRARSRPSGPARSARAATRSATSAVVTG